MLLGSAALLWLLWDGRAGEALLPVAIVVPASLPAGLAAIFVHATRYKAMLFYQGNTAAQSAAELRALEAGQVGALLVGFYVFLFLMLAALSLALSWPGLTESRRPWSDAPRPSWRSARWLCCWSRRSSWARAATCAAFRRIQADRRWWTRCVRHADRPDLPCGAAPGAWPVRSALPGLPRPGSTGPSFSSTQPIGMASCMRAGCSSARSRA